MTTDIARLVSYKKSFTASSGLVTISSTNETDLLLFKNPSGSTINFLITHFLIATDSSTVRSIFKIYKGPTITADGTALSEISSYIETSPPTAVATAFKSPTISARGSLLDMHIEPADVQSRGINRFYWIEPNNSLLITVKNSATNANSCAHIYWLEGP